MSRIVDLVQEAIVGSFCTIALDLPGSAHVDDPWCRSISGADDDTVSRFAGDEFVILCDQVFDDAHARTIATRVEHALEMPLYIHGTEVTVSASIGIALVTSSDDVPNRLLHEADTAMYRAKNDRRARAALFGSLR